MPPLGRCHSALGNATTAGHLGFDRCRCLAPKPGGRAKRRYPSKRRRTPGARAPSSEVASFAPTKEPPCPVWTPQGLLDLGFAPRDAWKSSTCKTEISSTISANSGPIDFVPHPYSRAKVRHRPPAQTQALTTLYFGQVAKNPLEDRHVKLRRALLDDDLRPGDWFDLPGQSLAFFDFFVHFRPFFFRLSLSLRLFLSLFFSASLSLSLVYAFSRSLFLPNSTFISFSHSLFLVFFHLLPLIVHHGSLAGLEHNASFHNKLITAFICKIIRERERTADSSLCEAHQQREKEHESQGSRVLFGITSSGTKQKDAGRLEDSCMRKPSVDLIQFVRGTTSL